VEPIQPKPVPLPAEPPEVVGPSDEDCLRELGNQHVRFSVMDELRNVRTPVEIKSPLGGVVYYTQGGGPFRLDCRFALTLQQLGPILTKHGVTRVRFSGAYVYKTAPSGRLSHHAYGVAIDLHDFETKRGTLTVKKDFRQGAGCGRGVPRLNRLACDLERQGIFDEFLTPDFNRAHRDHLHISISRF
jgi:hypothetical protein